MGILGGKETGISVMGHYWFQKVYSCDRDFTGEMGSFGFSLRFVLLKAYRQVVATVTHNCRF